MNPLIIGTRGSQLARTQTDMVADQIRSDNPDMQIEIRILTTKGDRITDAPLSSFGGEGVFVKELERALLSDEIDIAVHSLKDMPTAIPDGLALSAIPERADARDALISADGLHFSDLPRGARIGTSSLRRRGQLLGQRPDLTMVDLRGNLDTRLKKLLETDLDAIILATAGLDRLGWSDRITERLPCDLVLPAVGQGALSLETKTDGRARSIAATMNHERTELAVTAERAFLKALGGGCQTPIGGWARLIGDELVVDGLVADVDGKWIVRNQLHGPPDEAERLGISLAEKIAVLVDKAG
ncbi:MAG: hydroxymethylbilane synthase [Candidatus Latescibacteria bacterium]|jgi:hydroxymethylbilane synthase|nr:hydroxymethylbilane synthase [Candidatus Latescibacterota bacterium]